MHLLFSILTWIFIVGMAGSLVVAMMAFFGDLHVFMEKDNEPVKGNAAQRPVLNTRESQ